MIMKSVRDLKTKEFIDEILMNESLSIDKNLLKMDLSVIRSKIQNKCSGVFDVSFDVVDISSIDIPYGGLLNNRRAMKIKRLLEKGYGAQPVYFLDGVLVEGLHRLIAFDWHGLEDVLVVNIKSN